MTRVAFPFLLFLLLFPVVALADGTFADYPSSTTALAYDGEYFWIGQGYNVLKWDKNAGILAEYTPKDGLLGSTIKEIYIAPDKKTIWAASDSCIARFDGTAWHTFTPDEGIQSDPLGNSAFEQDGSIWILSGDSNGVFRFHGNEWRQYTTTNGLASNTVYAIAVDTEGVVWVGTDKGVSTFDGSTWKTYTIADGLPDNTVNRILVDKNNMKWFGIGGEVGGIARFDGMTWSAYNMANGRIDAINIRDMALSPDNVLYVSLCDIRYTEKIVGVQKPTNGVALYYNYIYKCDSNNISLVKSQVTDGYEKSPFLRPIIVDNLGKLYVLPTIPYNTIKSVFGYERSSPICDKDNVIWYIEDVWIASFDGNDRKGYGFGLRQDNSGLTTPSFCAFAIGSKNELWAIDSGGDIFEFADNTWKYSPYEYSNNLFVTSMSINEKDMIIYGGYNSILTKFQWDSSEQIASPLPSLFNKQTYEFTLKSVTCEKDNIFWVSFSSSEKLGVFRYDGADWKRFTTSDGLINNAVNAIAVDLSNSKWFGTSAGISRYDDLTWSSFATTATGDSIGSVNVLASGTGDMIWAGTNRGLLKYDGSAWTRLGTTDGLVDSTVISLAVNSKGVVWAGTPNGLSRYDGKTWKTFTTADGLPSNRVQALAADHNDVIWIGTDAGLVSYADDGTGTFVNHEAAKPSAFPTIATYPNPFNPSTMIECTLPGSGLAELAVYSITGQKMRTLAAERLSAGKHSFFWDGKDDAGHTVSSGIYIARLTSGAQMATKKMVLVK